MSYLVERGHVIRGADVVAILNVRHRGVRSHVLLADGSVVKTLTRPTRLIRLLRSVRERQRELAWLNDRRKSRK